MNVCHENRFNVLQNTCISCNCFIECGKCNCFIDCDDISNDFLTNDFDESVSYSDLDIINVDQGQNSKTSKVHSKSSINNCTNVTFCDDSQTDSFLKLAVLFQETMTLFLINQVYQVIIVKTFVQSS